MNIRHYILIKKNWKNNFIRTNNELINISRHECVKTDKKETLINSDKNVREKIYQNVFEHNKERFRETEQKFREKSTVIIKDIKEAKNKMKERMEEVIERENIYTIPNVLCVSRIAMTPYLGLLIVQSNFDLALAILGLAALTDLLDGWIARKWKSQSTKLGSFLDPMADKILISTLFLTLTYDELIPFALTAMIITRDVILVVAGFIIRYKSLPPPRTLARYFDASHATAQLAPTFISKANTVIQLLLVGSTLGAPVFHYIDHPILQSLWFITGATTIAAGDRKSVV